MRISDWSSDVCSSDLAAFVRQVRVGGGGRVLGGRWLALRPVFEQVGEQVADAVFPSAIVDAAAFDHARIVGGAIDLLLPAAGAGPFLQPRPLHRFEGELRFEAGNNLVRSEEHTSELQSLMRISYAVFCLKKTTIKTI